MPSWKKIITSGSSALLLNVTASSFTGSFTGSFLGTASFAVSASYAPSSGASSQWTSSGADIYYVLGNVGIGTNSPLAKTHIKGSGTTSATTSLLIENSALETILSVNDNKNIGILTTTPSASLDIAQSGVGGDYNALFLRAGNASTTSGSNQISFGYSAQTNYAHAIKTRHNSAAAAGNNIDFYTWKFGDNADTSSGQFVMTISGNNGVGVGTKSPIYTLDVSGSGRFTNNLIVTGSLNTSGSSTLIGTHTVTGKSALNGQVSQTVGSLSIVGTTASLDLSTGNFFTLTLVGGATNINTTNITAGQTSTVLITSAVGATVTFPTSVKQPSGSSYTPTSSAGAKDILTLISYDSSNVYIANVKNLI
jgi:hypothetical protein